MTVIHCQSTAERDSRKNKTAACRPNAENPGHSPFLSASLLPSEQRRAHDDREREMAADGQPAGDAALPDGPFTGVRRSPEGECTTVVPARDSALSQDLGAQP
jgi:hypothetical protein